MHDPLKKTIIPIFDFISTSHNSITISKYLFNFKKYLEIIVPTESFRYPAVIVVDFSWAFINSIQETFNKCTIQQYLDWSFDLIVLKKKKCDAFLNCLMVTKVYLCSTHFLKLIISKVDKLKVKIDLKRTFLLAFTLLQNSKELVEFEWNLKNIFYIFNQKV